MKHYDVISSQFRHFSLQHEGHELATLQYTQWFSFHAEIQIKEATPLLLGPKGFWDATIELKNGEEVLIDFKLGWKGIIFHVNHGGTTHTYLLKHKGILNSSYILIETNEQELLAVKPNFNFSKFKLDYAIETSEAFEQLPGKEAFLLTVIHSINYQMSMMVPAV